MSLEHQLGREVVDRFRTLTAKAIGKAPKTDSLIDWLQREAARLVRTLEAYPRPRAHALESVAAWGIRVGYLAVSPGWPLVDDVIVVVDTPDYHEEPETHELASFAAFLDDVRISEAGQWERHVDGGWAPIDMVATEVPE